MNKDYLSETKTINYGDPVIQEKVSELKAGTVTAIDYIVKAYEFVRDEIPHSWDIRSTVVSRKASDVLENRTGMSLSTFICAKCRFVSPGYQLFLLTEQDTCIMVSRPFVVGLIST